jgi:hypothetical protein
MMEMAIPQMVWCLAIQVPLAAPLGKFNFSGPRGIDPSHCHLHGRGIARSPASPTRSLPTGICMTTAILIAMFLMIPLIADIIFVRSIRAKKRKLDERLSVVPSWDPNRYGVGGADRSRGSRDTRSFLVDILELFRLETTSKQCVAWRPQRVSPLQ